MRSEIEFKWIVNLLNSQFLKGGVFGERIGGCLKDFEIVAGASQNAINFNKWAKELIGNGTFEFVREIKNPRGGKSKITYAIIFPKLESKLFKNPLHNPSKGYYWKYYKKKVGFFELSK